jgi:hypothetical protein
MPNGEKSFPPIFIKVYHIAMILFMAGLCCRQYVITTDNVDLKESNQYLADMISDTGRSNDKLEADYKKLEAENAKLRKLVFDYENRPPERWVIDNVNPVRKSK